MKGEAFTWENFFWFLEKKNFSLGGWWIWMMSIVREAFSLGVLEGQLKIHPMNIVTLYRKLLDSCHIRQICAATKSHTGTPVLITNPSTSLGNHWNNKDDQKFMDQVPMMWFVNHKKINMVNNIRTRMEPNNFPYFDDDNHRAFCSTGT